VETTKSVVSVGINPRIEQNKLGPELIQHIGELITDGGEIVLIFGAVGEGDINITVHFPKGEIACGMHRKRGDAFIRLKTGGGTITLVHIQIHNQNLLDFVSSKKNSRGHSAVIKNAKAAPKIRMGVVCPPC
jgi:hypothetical protein